jgi:prepilin-type N-terminal cleavage/methylation domain-containing protein
MKIPSAKVIQSGFTLVELTMVLIIVALLSTGLLFGVSAQRSIAENAEAQRLLENNREVLLGFAITRGRLPCPASPAFEQY